VRGGFTKDDFTIDTVAGTVTRPAGQTVAITSANNVVFWIRCRTCPLVSPCTTAKTGRPLNLHPQEDELMAQASRADDATLIRKCPALRRG
jgi:hypothetical protein